MQVENAPRVCEFDKVTLITGGSRGIGRGCAEVFTEAGAPVVICSRNRDVGEELAARLAEKGPGICHFEPCDVSHPDEIKNVIEVVIERHGRLDCLINNAGWHPPFKPIDQFSIEEFRDLLDLNLVSYFAACKFALPYLRKTKGSVINMGSLVGISGDHRTSTYCATKAGISGLTRALAIDEAANGVRINAVLPGNIITQSRRDLQARMEDGQAFHDYVERWQWIGRSGSIQEVGHACLFLASDNAGFITGIELILAGGAELGLGPKGPFPKF
jgi:NAD(P)-dependent dehydrogenase (short-subunit alcohol dehydrogenase family)